MYTNLSHVAVSSTVVGAVTDYYNASSVLKFDEKSLSVLIRF